MSDCEHGPWGLANWQLVHVEPGTGAYFRCRRCGHEELRSHEAMQEHLVERLTIDRDQ